MILLLPLAMASAGSWLVSPLTSMDAARRFALAVIAGLAVLLFSVSWVNLFLPLDGWGAVIAGAPIVVPLLFGSVRRPLLGDLGSLLRAAGAKWLLAGAALHLGLLLWPLIVHPSLIFFDGTSNHDSFFWISGAEYLKRHPYLSLPPSDHDRPFFNSAGAILTLVPAWGRMGSEGLLALLSSLAGASPVKIYVYATAALFFPWISACYLLIRTFLKDHLHGPALLALGLLQPIFVFFHSNSNLPNLMGALAAPLMILGTVHALARPAPEARWPAIAWCALGLHGLICSYPEMLPFVLLPCGLLWLRGGWAAPPLEAVRRHADVVLGFALGLAINPATAIRGYHGFMASFSTARANDSWGNLFEHLLPAEYLPALASLSVPACAQLGFIPGALLSVFLAIVLIYAVRAARDGIGVGCILSGSLLLLMYTLASDFVYGWQKTVQFGGTAIAALFPAGILALLPLDRLRATPARLRAAALASAVVLAVFYAFTTGWSITRTYFWARHKYITEEHLELRELSQGMLKDARVLVVAESFLMPFFHGMWAAYALPNSDLAYSPRHPEAGGYLRDSVREYQHGDSTAPDAVFVSRQWADTIDANSPRLLARPNVVILRETNHVLSWEGVSPTRALPEMVAETMRLEVWPHQDADLIIELDARDVRLAGAADVETTVESASGRRQNAFRSPAPWRIRLPLDGDSSNQVTVRIRPVEGAWEGEYPLGLRSIRIDRAGTERDPSPHD